MRAATARPVTLIGTAANDDAAGALDDLATHAGYVADLELGHLELRSKAMRAADRRRRQAEVTCSMNDAIDLDDLAVREAQETREGMVNSAGSRLLCGCAQVDPQKEKAAEAASATSRYAQEFLGRNPRVSLPARIAKFPLGVKTYSVIA